jgi:hypothetical protein
MRCTYLTSSVVTARRAGLREEVAVRHGWECVSTRLEEMTCAVHPDPHQGRYGMPLLFSICPCSPWQMVVVYFDLYSRCSREPTGGDVIQDYQRRPKQPASISLKETDLVLRFHLKPPHRWDSPPGYRDSLISFSGWNQRLN